jgi:DNA-binding NarL/FixJ family response regulator
MSALRILIADDHELLRQGLRGLLEQVPGWEICGEADTGQDAVAKTLALRPDVIVIDFNMPDLNGLEATRQIVEKMPQAEVLILTAYESERLAVEFLSAGARGFLFKTDSMELLVKAVEQVRQHKHFLPAEIAERVLAKFAALQARDGQQPNEELSPRECQVLRLIAEGKVSKEIAEVLHISIHTAETHRSNIMRKLKVHTVAELVCFAMRNGLIT